MPDTEIDLATFEELKASAGDDFVVEPVGTFLEEAPQMLAELRSAREAGAAERFRRAAHSLKSNSNTFGAVRLGAMARDLELGALPADAAPLDAIEAAYARTAAALKGLCGG